MKTSVWRVIEAVMQVNLSISTPRAQNCGRVNYLTHHALVMQAGDLFVIIVMISICSSGRSDPDQHLRPCDVAQHQVQQRGKLQEVLRLRHRPPQVCFKLSEILTTDHRFFSMSSLHIWFSKLKWSLDVLLRFYERHAFICALHKVSNISSLAFLLGDTLAHLVFS